MRGLEVNMRQVHHDSSLRRQKACEISFRFYRDIGLALVIALWISSEAWALDVSPTAMVFQAIQGTMNPSTQTITVSKTNSRQSKWTVTESAAWLSVSPGAGTISNTAKASVAVNTTGLAAGTYTTMITITLNRGGGSTLVPVTLTVAPLGTTSSTGTTSADTGGTATLTWNPNAETDLAGYNIYVGTASGVYGTPIKLGNLTSYVVSNLAKGSTYFFAVAAYDTSNNESHLSAEVSKSIY